MSIIRLSVPAAALAALLACTGGAMAVEAAAKSAVNVRTGPGKTFSVVDQLTAGEVVTIKECAPSNFCFVEHSGPDGWVSAAFLVPVEEEPEEDIEEGSGDNPDCSFGFNVGPDGPSLAINCGDGPVFPPPGPPPAPEPDPEDEPRACFYTGNNFDGEELCVGIGIRNALNATFNNKISSVELFGGAKTRLCEGPNLTGYCRTVSSDTAPLVPQINNKASSLTVYVGPAPLPLPAPPPPIVNPGTFSTGPIDLPQTWSANLDNGAVGGAGTDIWYEAVTSDEKYLTPKGSARLALGNGSNRGYEGCVGEDFSADRVALEDMPVGTYVCAKTDQGRISQFRVNGFVGTTMKLGYTTFNN
jgi:hypothetical protein